MRPRTSSYDPERLWDREPCPIRSSIPLRGATAALWPRASDGEAKARLVTADTDFSLLIHRPLGVATPDSRLLALSVAWGAGPGWNLRRGEPPGQAFRLLSLFPVAVDPRAGQDPVPILAPSRLGRNCSALREAKTPRGRLSSGVRSSRKPGRTHRLSYRPRAVRVQPIVPTKTLAGKGFQRWESRDRTPFASPPLMRVQRVAEPPSARRKQPERASPGCCAGASCCTRSASPR